MRTTDTDRAHPPWTAVVVACAACGLLMPLSTQAQATRTYKDIV
jgi:hypothetical protein